MRELVIVLLGFFCRGHASLGSPDIRNTPVAGGFGGFAPSPPQTSPRPPSPPPTCPDETLQHLPDPDTCIAFYECRGGIPIQRDCPEELLYNAHSPPGRYPCDYPHNVVCHDGDSPRPLPPPPPPQLPAVPSPTQPTHTCNAIQPTKVYNFYNYITNHY